MEEKLLNLYAKTKRQEARVQMYAVRAQKDNNTELEHLCEALSVSLKAQAKRILLQIRGFVSDTNKNIENLQSVELAELITQHKEIEDLTAGQNKALETGSSHSIKINTLNQNLVKQVENGKSTRSYHICDFCGYISRDKIPERCPICTAAPNRFIQVEK